MRLQEIFAIESVNINKDVRDVKRTTRDDTGNLYDVTVGRFVVDNYIQINFVNDFHVGFSRDTLIKAYNEKCEVEDVVRRLRKYIENEWLRRIYKC